MTAVEKTAPRFHWDHLLLAVGIGFFVGFVSMALFLVAADTDGPDCRPRTYKNLAWYNEWDEVVATAETRESPLHWTGDCR